MSTKTIELTYKNRFMSKGQYQLKQSCIQGNSVQLREDSFIKKVKCTANRIVKPPQCVMKYRGKH